MNTTNTTLGADPTREHRMVAAWSAEQTRLEAAGWKTDALLEGGVAVMSRNIPIAPEVVEMTRHEFLQLDPHFRTRADAPVLVTRVLPGQREILRVGVKVRLTADF